MYKSRFTGFRVARSLPAPARKPLDAGWLSAYNQPPAGYETATGALTPLLEGPERWGLKRIMLLEKWRKILGAPGVPPPKPQARLIETHHEQNYTGKLMLLDVEQDFAEKIYVMLPHGDLSKPRPVVIVPYYDIDVPAGRNLGGRSSLPAGPRSFAYLAVQRGFIAVAIRWFGESYGERMDEAVANLKLRHPQSTGLGKWVWDAHRLVDYLHTLPEVDRSAIGIIGHSLGAKMALYAAAMDERITAVVASEGGIGFKMSNYDDFWYLGEAMRDLPTGTDQHELLGLIAPRAFLLIGGDEYDGAESWHYINAARRIYRLLGHGDRIGYFNHHKGHSPTPEAAAHGMRWLEGFLSQ